jgi:hypothetical protein
MRIAIIILAVLFVVLLFGAIPLNRTLHTDIFYSAFFIIPSLALCISLIGCTLKRGLHWQDLGFSLTHLGIIIILCGACLSFWLGRETQFKLSQDMTIDRIPGSGEQVFTLGFKLKLKDFKVIFHPPVYSVYNYTPAAENATSKEQYTYLTSLKVKAGGIYVQGYGQVSLARLQEGQAQVQAKAQAQSAQAPAAWRSLLQLDQRLFLKLEPMTPSCYTAVLTLTDEEKGQTQEKILQVNHPLAYKGWSFYLVSYDQKSQQYIIISAYQDPGRWLVLTGLWLVIVSTFILCIFNKRVF